MIRVSLIGKQSGKQISARALLDSGAEGMIINHDFAIRNNLTLRTLRTPLPVKNVDGSLNKAGPIRHTTIQTIRIQTPDNHYHEERSEFYVTAVGTHDIILGTDWLKAHNPELDWTTSRLAFTRCPQSCTLTTRPLHISPVPSRLPAMYISRIEPISDPTPEPLFPDEALPYFLQQRHLFKKFTALPINIRRKTTHATKLASEPTQSPTLETIPSQFRKYQKLFNEQASERLPAHQPWDHAIELKPGTSMKNRGIYRLTPHETNALHAYISDHLKRGYIRPSKSPIASPFFFISKKNTTSLRPVQDYRDLNDITVKNAAPLPLIPELIDKLQGSRYFTKFDVRWGYNNIRIKEGDEWKAAFKCKLGLFEPLIMTFGLCNAPATFQTFMNSIFSDLIDQDHLVVYLDDILLFHQNLDALHDLTHEVLRRLLKYDLYLKPEKCFFDKTSIEYLGVIISDGQVRMDPAKLAGITKWPRPATVKEIQSFLGFCNFYRRFIRDFSLLAHPLHLLTKKDTPFHWTDAQESAFRSLIHAFTTAPVLALPDPSQPFRVLTDASDYALGAILEQPDLLNRWHPVAFYSKSMLPAEQNYDIHDKELLAIIRALESFRHYLEGNPLPFEVWTDHNNLAYFRSKQKLSRRQARWSLFLSQYNFTIIHKPGSFNKADALSRRPDHKEGIPPVDDKRVLLNSKFFSIRATRPTAIEPLNSTIRQRIKTAQSYDTEVSRALETILKSGPRTLTKGLEDWNLEDGIILHRGHVYVPKDDSLRRDLVKLYHDHPATGHPGRWKTYELISRDYWWPGLSQFTRNYVDGCAICQTSKNKPRTQVPLQPNPTPTGVWQAITMDFVTDLPESRNADSMFVVVDRFSKAIVITPCRKSITAEETAQLYMDHVWRRTGLPRQVISDRGPQFASKVMKETWKQLKVDQAMSTAFHPQTDGETERVNQEIEQFLRIFCNYQADNWANLLPFAEFAHNVRAHSATGHSPFQIWYGFQPDFLPPTTFTSQIPAVEDRLNALDQLRIEVSAALKLASEVMKRKGPSTPSQQFTTDQLVWLEGTNIKTTHPKAKLAPKRHGPFKILHTSPTNSRLQLPPSWRIHPVFHNSLLTPYKETNEHGPNFTRPPPDIADGETDHYEVETVLHSRPTPNRRGIQYLVKWLGYPDSENSWVSASGMKKAINLVRQFHRRHPNAPKPPVIRSLQPQRL
jgi:transposase InsO family protein